MNPHGSTEPMRGMNHCGHEVRFSMQRTAAYGYGEIAYSGRSCACIDGYVDIEHSFEHKEDWQ